MRSQSNVLRAFHENWEDVSHIKRCEQSVPIRAHTPERNGPVRSTRAGLGETSGGRRVSMIAEGGCMNQRNDFRKSLCFANHRCAKVCQWNTTCEIWGPSNLLQ